MNKRKKRQKAVVELITSDIRLRLAALFPLGLIPDVGKNHAQQ